MDKEIQINVYPITPGNYDSLEYRHIGCITTKGTNYIDLVCEEGMITITLNRDRNNGKLL